MPSRAQLLWNWKDELGNNIPAATVEVFEPGTTTKIAETIYVADDPDTSVYPNPFTSDANGIALFYLAKAKRVDVRFSKTGYDTKTLRLDVTHVANRFTFRNAYSALTTYAENDVVTYNGESWVALRTSTGITPVEGADWSRMAAKGADAPAGTINQSIVDAKGDLIVATAADTVARKAIGAEGTVPVSRAADATGIAWEVLSTGGGANEIGYAQVTGNQPGIGTTATDLTGLSVAVTVGANPIVIFAKVQVKKNTSAGSSALSIMEGTTFLQDLQAYAGIGSRGTCYGSIRLTPTAGAHTYKLALRAEADTTDMEANTTSPAFIQVIEVV